MASKLYQDLQKLYEDSPYKKGAKKSADKQKKRGKMGWDGHPNTQKARSKNGTKLGKWSVESGHQKRIAPLGGKVTGPKAVDPENGWINSETRHRSGVTAQKIEYTCPHCGYQDNGPNIKKSHFDKCKGYIDVFEFVDGKVGKLVGTYNNQKDIVNDFDSISAGILSSAIRGKKKQHHPHYVGGYVVIARGINNKNK